MPFSFISETSRSMAAAYAVLVSLFNNLELIQTHPRHSFSFENKQIQSLLQIVRFLIDFMETGDYHGGSKEAAEVLERQIASAAHAAEDVVESHVVDQIHAGSTLDGKKRSRFLLDVQKVIEDMEFVRRKAIKVQKAHGGFGAAASAAISSTPLGSEKRRMVGFDDKLLQLLDLLTGEANDRRVIPISGMGGIGKTTLAKNAFDHPRIVQHFDVRLWVTISQQYVVSDILLTLLSRQGESNCETADELGVQLHRRLYGRRYLIVLDDMWSVEAWDKIKCFFPDTRSGSRIILTSRQSDVVDHFGSLSLAMSFLEKDESWHLFCQKTFAEQKCPRELEEAGKKIVEKCGGLPLAIVVVGGHLRMSPRKQEYWENLANHMKTILNFVENDEQLFDILCLSYSHLPAHLKPCFLYMGVFPKDYVISVSFLTWLWIAEGFLKPNKDQTLEEVAEGCLNDLIGRNLILVDDWSVVRKSETCVIHDVLRELCLKIAEKEKFFCVFDTSRPIHRERRVVINQRNPKEMEHVLRSTPLVCSHITWKGCHVWSDSKLLRVVTEKESEERIDKLENIFRRVNLRFLDGCFQLNSSISLLWNLQILIIKEGDSMPIAPFEIWEMTQLRHLKCSSIYLVDPLPSDQFDKTNDMVLRNLQTLEVAINLRLSDEVCKRIPNIKELRMSYSGYSMECDEPSSYCPHNLGRLHKLESLHCTLNTGPEWHAFAQALTFPSSLKKLSLLNVHLDWEEMTTKIGSLPLLEVLSLVSFRGGAEWNPVEGGFSRLRSLEIFGCDDLTYWNLESSHFPVLEDLSFGFLRKLDEFPCGIGEIPTLERIDLQFCNMHFAVSALRTVVEQEHEHGTECLQLNVMFWDDEELERFNKRVQEEGLRSNNLKLDFQGVDFEEVIKIADMIALIE